MVFVYDQWFFDSAENDIFKRVEVVKLKLKSFNYSVRLVAILYISGKEYIQKTLNYYLIILEE